MSESRKLTREEIWERIRTSSKDAVALAEMKRLGFWPADGTQPTLAEEFIKERGKLQARLSQLTTELAQVADPEVALKQLHKERKEAALERREETRRKRNQARFDRAAAWHRKQQAQITYLGEGSHTALAQNALDHGRLAGQSLPLIGDAAELAAAMGITINELRFLCYQRDVSTVSHYQRFAIPKKSGGERIISAPMPRLKRAQYWLLANILDKIAPTDSAQGFVKGRNILSNALPHVGKAVVVNLDLENFFPSISYARVKGIYRQLGYSEAVATLCAMLSTEADTATYELDGQQYFVKTGAARLPQGAPTSPALSNLLCRRLDKRLRASAVKLGFSYSRYADDLSFSAAAADDKTLKQLLWRVRKIVASEGLRIHPDKTQIMRSHQRQEVTGIVVNQVPSVCRKELKNFRALLFQIDKDGPDGKHWRAGLLFESIEGYANFVAMVHPEKGAPLRQQVAALKQKYRAEPSRRPIGLLSATRFRAAAAAGCAPRTPWWQAQPKPCPEPERTQQQSEAVQVSVKAVTAPAQANQPALVEPPHQPVHGTKKSFPWWVWWMVAASLIWVVRRLND